MAASSSNHWLRDVAAHAGHDLEIPRRPDINSVKQAWSAAAKACNLSDEEFTNRVAGFFRIGVAELETYDPQAVKLIPESVARRHGILPLSSSGESIVIATSDPTSRGAHREIVAHSNRKPVYMMASPYDLARSLERAYAPARAPKNALQTLVAQVASSDFQVVTNEGMGRFTGVELEDPSVVKLADVILQQGVRHRATEIHVEPGAEKGRVRYRIDGVLQHVVDLPPAAHHRLMARLKHLAFDQADAVPEEGYLVEIAPGRGMRVHLLATPTPDGELGTIRLADPHDVPTIEDLGLVGRERAKILEAMSHKEGLILVTGPARSGTTSFIYASLASLRRENVLSLEGRPELVVPGVTQIRYDASSGRSFAEALGELLDRNPDVLHAGEIRDLATARIALRTAVTGRKVLATVHTSDAISGIRRLIDMGLDPGRLGESLDAVISLRLVRKLCRGCARPFDPHQDAHSREATLAATLDVIPVKRAVGCKACAGTGYRGQIPIPEVLIVTPGLEDVLDDEPSDAELLRAARADGMRTFGEVGLERVSRGETTVEELERVLGVVPTRDEAADQVGPVLLVDDDAQDRRVATEVLSRMGFEVREASDGITAKELIESGQETYSLVLMDLYISGMDGKILLRTIRQQLSTQALPVIVLTASANPRDEVELLEAGADDFLLQPIVAERLEARVRAVLRRSGVRIN